MKKLKKRLPCRLDDAEIAVLADKAHEHTQNAKSLKLRASEAAKDFKEKISSQSSRAEELLAQIHERMREEDVECGEIIIPDAGEAITLRFDTGEEINRRRITDEDRQGDLLTLVPPASEEEAADQDKEQRIRDLFALADMLKDAGMELGRNLKRLWTLDTDRIAEARKWAMQKKSVGLSETADAPEWLLRLQAESLKDVQAEKESEIRANTLKVVLIEQALKVEVEDIRSWSTADQNAVLGWTDSLLGETPLPRPEFLSKYDPQQMPDPAAADNAPDSNAEASADTKGQADSDNEATGAATADQHSVVAQDAMELEDVDAIASANGHCPISREDLALKISEFGVNVDQSAVEAWSEQEADLAFEWVVETADAINANGERKPAPDFFFK